MMLRGYGAFYTVLENVRDACRAELQSISQPMPRVAIMPGWIAWDECEQCGLLGLTAVSFYLTDNFPMEVIITNLGEGAILGGNLMVQAIRCAPQPQGTDLAPKTDVLESTAKIIQNDAWAVMCATRSTLSSMKDDDDIIDYMIRQQLFSGPQGACVGSELAFAVGVEK